MSEELQVIFHAVAKSRCDVIQQAVHQLRTGTGVVSAAQLISTGRAADNATPLHLAANIGNADVIRALLNAGASVTAETAAGERPYEWATQDPARQAFHLFLYEAIAAGNVAVIEQLLAGGVQSTVTLFDGSPMLCVAASFGNIQVAQTLLQQGCSVDGVNTDGQTALHLACKEDNAQLVEILLDEGAAVDALDAAGHVPSDLLKPDSASPIREMLSQPHEPTYRFSSQLRLGLESAMQQLGAAGMVSPSLHSVSQDSVHSMNSARAFVSHAGHQSLHQPQQQQQQQQQPQQSVCFDEDDDDLFLEEWDGYDGGADGAVGHHMQPIKLVLWPPPQRQRRKTNLAPFVFASDQTAGIAAHTSLLGPTSILIEALERLNIRSEISPAGASAAVRLAIDKYACPGYNRYDLTVDPKRIQLTASDTLGLRYGVQCLVQLLKLHSHGEGGGPAGAAGAVHVLVPSIAISDWPDVETRAVLWSCREQACASASELRSTVALMSEARLNTMFLSIDPDTAATAMDAMGLDSAAGGRGRSRSSSGLGGFGQHEKSPPCWTTIIDLEESCAKEMIQLVPTVVFTSLRQSLPVGALKHMSHPMIQIVLLLEERAVAAELMELEAEHDMALGHRDQHHDQDREDDEGREGSASRGRDSPQPRRVITSIDVENAARAFCAGVLSSVSEARGYQSTVLVSSAWTRRVAQPLSMALRLGLECCERPAQLLFPGGLFVKPLVAAQELVRGVASAVQRSLQLTNNVCVLPAFVDSEFMVPGLLVKFAQFLHGGFAWNFGTAMDILWVEGEGEGEGPEGEGRDTTETEAEAGAGAGAEADGTGANGAVEGGSRCGTGAGAGAREGRFDGSIARDVLSLALFKRPADEAGPEAAAILSLLTGELFADGPQGQGQGQGQGVQIDFQALAAVDRVVWAILTSPASVHDIALPPKTDFALCLKVHKRLLNAAKWHPSSTNGGSNGQGGAGGGLGLGLLRLWGAASPPIPLSLDLDEFLSVVHLASVVTRAIVLAYSVHDKATAAAGGAGNGATGGMVTLGAALAHLPPGLNSDVANSLLEGLERCVGLWRRRFRSLSIFDLGSGSGGGRLVPFRQARARFFRGQMHGLPALAFLGTRGGVRDKLPRPTVVDDTFTRLFAESA